ETDASQADHRDAGAWPDLRRLDRRAHAGRDAAAEQARPVEGYPIGERDGLRGMHHGSRGERAACEDARKRRAVPSPPQPWRLGPRVSTAPRLVAKARPTGAARNGP